MATLAATAFDRDGAFGGGDRRARRAAFLTACLYGLADEVHQFFTPGRCCSVYDVLIDALGAAAATALPWRLWRKPSRRAWRASRRTLVCTLLGLLIAAATSKSRPWPDLALEGLLGIMSGRP